MMRPTKIAIILLLLGLIVFTGCNTLNTKNPILNDPNPNQDLKNYKALTPEAQAIIDKMVRGEDPGRVLNGGGTPELMNSLKGSQSEGTFTAQGMPSTQPNSAATRPKITLVMKEGGPAETYRLNYQDEISYFYANPIKHFEWTSVSSKRWFTSAYNRGIVITYTTILFQDIYDDANSTGAEQYIENGQRGWYENEDIVAVDTFDGAFADGSIMRTTVSRTVPDTSYNYQNIPANVFEDPNGAPIQETWYWNPPWHFDRVNFLIANNGSLTYDAVARPGAEQQMLVVRWTWQDFTRAYLNGGGWKDQGWRIKDIDVENGIVCALLTPGTYGEVMMIYQTDDYVNSQIGLWWNLGYRGVVVDSSW